MGSSGKSQFVIGDAEFLFERLRDVRPIENAPASESDYEEWKKRFLFGNNDLFHRRLQSLEISDERARIVAGHGITSLTAGPEPTDWSNLLRAATRFTAKGEMASADIPFGPLWEPLALFAESRLVESDPRLSRSAKETLTKHLLSEMSKITADPVYLEYETFRKNGCSFAEFIKLTQDSEYGIVFNRFPALARSVAGLIDSWIETTNKFLRRLNDDWDALSDLLGAPVSIVTSIEPGLSDRHEGGFQALCLEFDHSLRVLYKPKDFSLEAGLQLINQWLNAEAAPFQFRFPATVNRGDYGWAEFIRQNELDSLDQVQEYYRRAGRLLALGYLLNARDLLVDNIITAGIDPVPIDLETFLQGELQSGANYGQPPSSSLSEMKQLSSVMDTGFLPIWQISGINAEIDLSGLAGNKESVLGLTRTGWKHVNSDQMEPVREPVTAPAAHNKVIRNGQAEKAADYAKEVVEGFREFFRFALEHQQSLLVSLEQFAGMRGRTIYRSTAIYAQLIKDSLSPVNLISGIKRSLSFERLYRPFILSDKLSAPIKALLDSEIERLSFLDIPRLYATLGSDQLEIENGPAIPHAFWESPLATVGRRIQNAKLTDLCYHEENINESLKRRPLPNLEELSEEKSIELANQLAAQILDRHDSEAIDYLWPLPSFARSRDVPIIERLSLYSGDLGILIFLASTDKFTSLPMIRDLETKFLNRWLDSVPEPREALGICTGSGSLIYSGVCLHQLTGNERWLEFASTMAWAHTAELIKSCAEPDLTSGISGLLTAFLALFQITEDARLKALAKICADELRNRFDHGWERPDAPASLGFAHGCAGIAFAGARYGAQTGDDLGHEIARLAVDFDRRFYADSARNWPVTVSPNSGFMMAWCSGLPGILLSRCFVGRVLEEPAIAEEIRLGIPVLTNYFSGMDHWCCGNLGNAEILLTLAEETGDEVLADTARALILKTINQARRCAFYRFSPSLGENYSLQPGLFRGSAGLGYSLLRASDKLKLPSIVAFQGFRFSAKS